MRQVMAMILAGGQGKGLGVLTRHRPSAAMPFGGKYRVLDFSLSNCVNSDLYRIAVLTQYAPTSLNDHIRTGRPWDLDRREGGVRLLQAYARREGLRWYRGPADALAQNLSVIDDWGARWVLVLSGDQVYKMDYTPLVEAHIDSGCAVTMTVKDVPESDLRRFGVVETDARDRLIAFEEKPRAPRSSLANLGIYVFDADLLFARLGAGAEATDIVTDLIQPLLAAGEPIQCYRYQGYWDDIGTVDSYFRSNMELLSPRPRLNLADPDWRIYTPSEERPPFKICAGGRIDGSLVANGAVVEGWARDSILFPGARVERGAEVTSSIIMQDSVIERDARVDLAILDKQVRIGRATVIGDDPRQPASADGSLSNVTVVGKYARVPAGCRVGRRCVIDIGARGEHFASSELVPGTRVQVSTA